MVLKLSIEKARAVLQLDVCFSKSDVKKQFRMLALHCHPDKIKNSGEGGKEQQQNAVEAAKTQYSLNNLLKTKSKSYINY